jgi:hypothetical protein
VAAPSIHKFLELESPSRNSEARKERNESDDSQASNTRARQARRPADERKAFFSSLKTTSEWRLEDLLLKATIKLAEAEF